MLGVLLGLHFNSEHRSQLLCSISFLNFTHSRTTHLTSQPHQEHGFTPTNNYLGASKPNQQTSMFSNIHRTRVLWGLLHQRFLNIFWGDPLILDDMIVVDINSDKKRTYSEVWWGWCWPPLHFQCHTCQRRSPWTSPFCPFDLIYDVDASDVERFWEHAHQCKWCGDLHNKKQQMSVTSLNSLIYLNTFNHYELIHWKLDECA